MQNRWRGSDPTTMCLYIENNTRPGDVLWTWGVFSSYLYIRYIVIYDIYMYCQYKRNRYTRHYYMGYYLL